MKKFLLFFKTTLVVILLISCDSESKTNGVELYNEKAAELITQILSENFNYDCVAQTPEKSFIEVFEVERPAMNVKADIIKHFNLENERELDSLILLSRSFKIDESMLRPSVKIIDRVFFDTLSTMEELRNVREIINKKCSKNVLFISKPFFNKNFTTALIDISQGRRGCLVDPLYKYQFEKGYWVAKN